MSNKSIIDLIYDVFYWIDSIKFIDKVVAVVQGVASISAFLYASYENTQKYTSILFFICQTILILFFVLSAIISDKYLPIKLRLNRITGALYDSTTRFINVSIRGESLNTIFDNVENGKKSFDIGKKVGENFSEHFNRDLLLSGRYKKEEILKKWLEYDSSSGMGKFDLIEYSDNITIIEVNSPLIEYCPQNNRKLTNICCFLKGYVEGVSSKLLGQNLNSICKPKNDPPRCMFILEPSKTSDSSMFYVDCK